jgi:hypothetical protein
VNGIAMILRDLVDVPRDYGQARKPRGVGLAAGAAKHLPVEPNRAEAGDTLPAAIDEDLCDFALIATPVTAGFRAKATV